MQISSTVSDAKTDDSIIQLCYPKLTFDSEHHSSAVQDTIAMSVNGFQDDSSDCSGDEYEIVSHQSDNGRSDQLDEESVAGSARDGAEMTDDIVSHGSIDGGQEHEDGEEHDLVEEDRDDDGLEEEKDEETLDRAAETAEDESGELGSAATIVPSHSEDNADEEDFDDADENGILHFKEMKLAGRDDLVLGILKEHSNDAKAVSVCLPMSNDRLSVTKPFRIYYGGPRNSRKRVIEKIGSALALSDVIPEADSLGSPERFGIFNVSPADMNDPKVELVRSANVQLHVYDFSLFGLKREDCYDLVVLIDDSTTAFDQHRCIAWDLPLILIGSSDKTLSRIMASGRLMLHRVHDDLSSVTADPEASRLERLPSPVTAVGLAFFEGIDADQLNRHIASLVESQVRASHKLQKSALGTAVNGFLTDVCDTVYEIGSYVNHSIRDVPDFCKKKISSCASGAFHRTEQRGAFTAIPRVSANPGKWLRTLVTLFGTFTLLRLSTYAVGALVINPSLAVSSFVGSNTMSYFHQGSNQSWVAQHNTTADTIPQVQATATGLPQLLEETQPASEPRSDIMPVYGSEPRALAQHSEHRDQQASKKCPPKCRAASWALIADDEKFMLSPSRQASWGRALCEPILLALDQSARWMDTRLVKVNANLYELDINNTHTKEVLLVSTMFDDGYLIKGHAVSKVTMPDLKSADADIAGIAVTYMLNRRQSSAMDLVKLVHKDLQSLGTTVGLFQARVQDGTAALLEKCDKAVSLAYSRVNIPRKDSTSTGFKEDLVAKPSRFDTKAIAAAYKAQVRHIEEWKASAWAKAQDMFGRNNGEPSIADARDFVQELQHRSKAAVEKMQKDALSAVKKASGQAKSLEAGLRKKTGKKMAEKEVKPAPNGRRA